jgi:hypothetical protein
LVTFTDLPPVPGSDFTDGTEVRLPSGFPVGYTPAAPAEETPAAVPAPAKKRSTARKSTAKKVA